MSDDRDLTTQEAQNVHYIRQRLGVCRAVLLGNGKPLHARLQRAYVEGFAPTLTDLFADSHRELRQEWEVIGEDFTRIGRINVTLAAMSEPDLEALEARVLAFISRYLAATNPPACSDSAE